MKSKIIIALLVLFNVVIKDKLMHDFIWKIKEII
jgi:hypothetical protein